MGTRNLPEHFRRLLFLLTQTSYSISQSISQIISQFQYKLEYKIFRIGNEKVLGEIGSFLAKKYLDKVIDISRVIDRVVVIKLLVQRIIVSLISVYAPQCGLNDCQKDNFYSSLINRVRTLGQKEILVIIRLFVVHVESNVRACEENHIGYHYGVRHKERESMLVFVAAINVGNTHQRIHS